MTAPPDPNYYAQIAHDTWISKDYLNPHPHNEVGYMATDGEDVPYFFNPALCAKGPSPARPSPLRRFRSWVGVPAAVRLAATEGACCSHPVSMFESERLDTETGEITTPQDAKRLLANCGNRRESVCPHCSKRYKLDAYHLAMAGVSANQALTFVTLTPGGFGKPRKDGKGIVSCQHWQDGVPKSPDRFDYERAVSFNSASGALWSDFLRKYKLVRFRHYSELGLSPADARTRSRDFKVFRVTELQKRGVVHHHALFAGVHDSKLLRKAAELASSSADGYRHEYGKTQLGELTEQGCHIKLVPAIKRVADSTDAHSRFAAYFAKYLTKSTACSIDHATGKLLDHYQSMQDATLELEEARLCDAASPCEALQPDNTYNYGTLLNCKCSGCRIWRNQRRSVEYFGLRGHVLSKSQTWGLSFAAIRQARRTFKLAKLTPSVLQPLTWRIVSAGWSKEYAKNSAIAQSLFIAALCKPD